MEKIMVIKKDKLFGNDYFEGFKPRKEVDFLSRILSNYKWKKRSKVEHKPEYKQPIPYCLIYNPELKMVFTYQRSTKDKDYPEKRLQGKWSCGVGGHINKKNDAHYHNPIHKALIRELSEEVMINNYSVGLIGYINEPGRIDKVHFGLLFLIKTNSSMIKSKDAEIIKESVQFKTINELLKNCYEKDYEEWTRISIKALSDFFKNP